MGMALAAALFAVIFAAPLIFVSVPTVVAAGLRALFVAQAFAGFALLGVAYTRPVWFYEHMEEEESR